MSIPIPSVNVSELIIDHLDLKEISFDKISIGQISDFNYFNNPREYIANSFDMYYRSDETRERLRLKNPGIFKLLSEVESNILDGSEGLEGVAKREDYEKVLNRQRSSWYLFRRLRGSN